MASNLAGHNLSETFSAAGITIDSAAPYTNTGGGAATLTLETTATDVIVLETAGSFSGAGEPIALILAGPGQVAFEGDDSYSGGTTIDGGVLDLESSAAAGTGAIAFAADAFATLRLAFDVDPANAITLPDATDALDFAGLAYADGDKLALTSGGAVSTYALETAGGAVLATLRLTGAQNDGSLKVASDGAGGTEIAVAYSAAGLAGDEATVAASQTPVFLDDSAANIASHRAALETLLDDGIIAAVYATGAALNDSSNFDTTFIGGGDTIQFGLDSYYHAYDLQDTNGDWDLIGMSGGVLQLDNAQASLVGADDTVHATGAGDAVSLYATNFVWDLVGITAGTVYLTNAQASVVGGGNAVVALGSANSDAISLYDTNGDWDWISGAAPYVFLNDAQVSLSGSFPSVEFRGSDDAVAFYGGTSTVNGSDGNVYLVGGSVTITGDDVTVHASGAGNTISLTPYNLFSDNTVYAAGATIDIGNYNPGYVDYIVGGDDTVNLAGRESVLYLCDTDDDWDNLDVAATNTVTIYLSDAKASISGALSYANVQFLGSSGNIASFAGGGFELTGSDGVIDISGGGSGSIEGGGDTINLSGNGTGATVFGNGLADVVNGVAGTSVSLYNAQATVNGNGQQISMYDSDVTLGSAGDTFLFTNYTAEFPSYGQNVIRGFAASDVIALSAAEFGDWALLKNVIHQSGADAVIPLVQGDSITLQSVQGSLLTASQFTFS